MIFILGGTTLALVFLATEGILPTIAAFSILVAIKTGTDEGYFYTVREWEEKGREMLGITKENRQEIALQMTKEKGNDLLIYTTLWVGSSVLASIPAHGFVKTIAVFIATFFVINAFGALIPGDKRAFLGSLPFVFIGTWIGIGIEATLIVGVVLLFLFRLATEEPKWSHALYLFVAIFVTTMLVNPISPTPPVRFLPLLIIITLSWIILRERELQNRVTPPPFWGFGA